MYYILYSIDLTIYRLCEYYILVPRGSRKDQYYLSHPSLRHLSFGGGRRGRGCYIIGAWPHVLNRRITHCGVLWTGVYIYRNHFFYCVVVYGPISDKFLILPSKNSSCRYAAPGTYWGISNEVKKRNKISHSVSLLASIPFLGFFFYFLVSFGKSGRD